MQDIPLSPRDRSYATGAWIADNVGQFRDRPMLVCWGEGTGCSITPSTPSGEAAFPARRYHTFPGAGHYVLEDASGPIVELIRAFLARTAAPAARAPEEAGRAAARDAYAAREGEP